MGDGVSWTQLSLVTDDQVTEVTVRVGVVSPDHCQAQYEIRDADDRLVAMVSRPHFVIADLRSVLDALAAEIVASVEARHDPF